MDSPEKATGQFLSFNTISNPLVNGLDSAFLGTKEENGQDRDDSSCPARSGPMKYLK
jgi:hypothetical protein